MRQYMFNCSRSPPPLAPQQHPMQLCACAGWHNGLLLALYIATYPASQLHLIQQNPVRHIYEAAPARQARPGLQPQPEERSAAAEWVHR